MSVLAHPVGLDPLIAEAKERARRRRLLALAAAGILIASAIGFELSQPGSGGGTSGTIPWISAKPSIGPAHPPFAPPCTASQLGGSLFLQGAAMSLGGPIELVNRSSRACSLLGRPALSFANATSKSQVTREAPPGLGFPRDPLAPPRGSLRALAPGEHVAASLFWSNWCGTGAKPDGNLTKPPSAIVLTLPGGGRIDLTNPPGRGGLASPVCNGGAGSTSTLAATPFMPFVPLGPPSSALPLRARIVSGAPLTMKGKTVSAPSFAARAGSWLSFTVILTNIGHRSYAFGSKCPAYVEDWGGVAPAQAYVLNCRPVGSIAPGRSMRFAMRIRVPHTSLSLGPFGWTLAPHTYNAPYAMGTVRIR